MAGTKILVDLTPGADPPEQVEIPLTPTEEAALLALREAAVPPVVYAGREDIEPHVQTTGVAPVELIRLPLALVTVYSAMVELYAIDATNGVTKLWLFRSAFKRLNNGALAVGSRQDIVPPVADSGAAATTAGVANWAITLSLSGNDAVMSVTGHTGRTVDWFAFVTLRRFTPGGEA